MWGGDAHLLMTPSRIGEYTKGWRGTMSGGKEQKGVAWWKADTYQFRINVHFKTSFLKQDKRLRNEGRGFHTVVNFCYFLLPAFQKHGLFILNQEFFVGKHYNRSLSISLSSLLKWTSWMQDLLYPFPWKRTTWSQDWAHFYNSDWLSSP